jgi:hypothetical protein
VERCPALVLRSPAEPDEGGCEAEGVATPALYVYHDIERG